jgi:histidine decarboxylase
MANGRMRVSGFFRSGLVNEKLRVSALDQKSVRTIVNYHINNVGDPFISGNLTLNSKVMERAVLDYYAALWHAQWPHDPHDGESYWGYVVTMGCTEGNLYGLWNARDYLAGKLLLEEHTAGEAARLASLAGSPQRIPRRLIYKQATPLQEMPNAYTPIAFYSEDTHYSIVKAGIILGLQTFYEIGTQLYPEQNPLAPGQPWPKEVPSVGGAAGPGAIDIDALVQLVEFFASKGYPILICFNYGTTFKGAYDDVEAAGVALMPVFKRFGLDQRQVYYDPNDPSKFDRRTGFWFHVDGALGAAYMPFLEMAYQSGESAQRGPNFDFRLPFVHSIAMSGHKWIGSPCPCGIYMTKTKYQLRPPDNPEYLGSPDTTFAGSRSGLAPMFLWDYLAKNSYEQQIQKALYTERMADYAHKQLQSLEEQLGKDLWIERTPLSLTIRFRKAHPDIIEKYSLSSETLYVQGQKRAYNHIFIMAHVTPELIDRLIEDLGQPEAFSSLEEAIPGVSERMVVSGAKDLVHVPHTGRGFR